MRRVLLAAAVVAAAAAAGAAVAVFALDGGGGAAAGLGTRAASAQATIEPRAHLFGDSVSAQVEAVVDPSRVDPASLRLEADFTPYEPVAPVSVERRDVGALTRLRFTVPLRCLEGDCVPSTARRVFAFQPGALVAGGRRLAELEWPEVEVTSRITQSGLVRESAIIQLDWRANMTQLPPVSYRVPPVAAAAAFAGLAGILVAGALALLVVALRRPASGPPPLPPLERALALLDAARGREAAEEERKALDLLAAELALRGEEDLARAASELAWSRRHPAREATGTLSERVAELVERGRNGHGP